MSAITRDVVTQSLHEQVMNVVAQRWARSWQCRITINSDEERASIVGWSFKGGRNTAEWVAEVETEASLAEEGVGRLWQNALGLGVPLFVFVPKGCREQVQTIALGSNVIFNGVYEYAFVNGAFQLS